MSGHVIIPAAPGFYTLEEVPTGELVRTGAIIAWKLDPEDYYAPLPITNDGEAQAAHILHPDGFVFAADGWMHLIEANAAERCAERAAVRKVIAEYAEQKRASRPPLSGVRA